jgi:hypothetical protein
MGFLRGIDRSARGSSSPTAHGRVVHEHRRQTVRSGRLAAGTLACRRCDAPIAIGADVLSLGTQLLCPYCHNRGPVRDFLSLALPTRPAHVVVRISQRLADSGRT